VVRPGQSLKTATRAEPGVRPGAAARVRAGTVQRVRAGTVPGAAVRAALKAT
jgi:hypothetical protein